MFVVVEKLRVVGVFEDCASAERFASEKLGRGVIRKARDQRFQVGDSISRNDYRMQLVWENNGSDIF